MRLFLASAVVTLLAAPALADRAPRSGAPAGPANPANPAPRPAVPPPAAPAPAAQPRSLGPPGQPATVQLSAIDLATVPAPCQPLARRALAASSTVALSARISLASCMADRAIAPLSLCDCGESIQAIDAATAPALAVLDDVIDAADPAVKVIAEHTEGQLYAGFVVRLLATLPRVGPGASDAEVALRDMRKQTLEAQLAPWREAALAAFQHVIEISRAHPEISGNPAVASAVRDSERQIAASVATR